MERRHERDRAIALPLAAQMGDRDRPGEQSFYCRSSQGDDCLGLNQIDLLLQIRDTSRHLLRSRLAIAEALTGRIGTTFQNVRDVNSLPRESHRLNNPGQQLAGSADEWFALLVLIGARRLPD